MGADWAQAWREATVTGSREVGRGCRLLRLELRDDLPFPYQPGHVVVLRHAGQRHPYTVARPEPERRSLDLIYRVIPGGRLTPVLEALAAGTRMELSGLHHVPVLEGIAAEAAEVVGLSTGSGIGPLWGFAEQALATGFPRPIALFAGFREAADVCLAPELDALQARYPHFRWRPTLTSPPAHWTGLRGRLGESVPPLVPDPMACHFHLVGNGAMIAQLKAALEARGVPEARVTTETFFNHNAKADPEGVRAIVERFR